MPNTAPVTIEDIAAALSYCESEFNVEEVGGIDGEMWAEGFAFGRSESWRPWELEHARKSQVQLTAEQWETIAARGREMKRCDGCAYDFR